MTPKEIAKITRAFDENPHDPVVRSRFDTAIHRHLPGWHWAMIHDEPRNKFYGDMIRKHVKGKNVLDIGAGTGFLSLLAAEAGANQVYACEMNPLFYEIAKENIEKSPYEDRIELFSKRSDLLKLKTHIPAKVDVIVSEILSSDVFSEMILPALRDAKRFLKPGGVFLPPKVEVFASLVEVSAPIQVQSHPLAARLASYLSTIPRMISAQDPSFRALSAPKKIATIDGAELDVKPPWNLTLKRTQKSNRTFVCVYFKAVDGKNQLTNFPRQHEDDEILQHATSWGQFVYPVDQRDTYKLEVHLFDEKQTVIVQK